MATAPGAEVIVTPSDDLLVPMKLLSSPDAQHTTWPGVAWDLRREVRRRRVQIARQLTRRIA